MLSIDEIIFLAAAFLLSWLISFVSIPTIVHIAKEKNLCAGSNARSSHAGWVPNLGGVALFASLMLAMNFFGNGSDTKTFHFLMGGMVILFFLGLKDDILVLDPMKKLAGQILVSLLLALFADVHLDQFYGFLGLEELSYPVSVCLSVFGLVVIINAYNLIDGIDGLASGIGLVCSGSFTAWFLLNGFYTPALVGLALMGALSSFFYFNVYSRKNKLFMGDTGSMIVGLILGVMAIKFVQMNALPNLNWQVEAAPAIAFGILAVPLFDVLRVMTLRISRKRSPFHADKSHIHHLLLRAGYNHRQTTFRIIVANLIFVLLCFFGRNWSVSLLLLAVLTLATGFTVLVIRMASHRKVLPLVQMRNYIMRKSA